MENRILLLTTIILYLANAQGVPIQNELAAPIDCKGKDFFCVDSKHFVHCFDVSKNGKTQTVDNKVQQCGVELFCDNSQPFECISTIDPAIATSHAPADHTQSPTETSVSSGPSQVPGEPTTDAVPVIPVETTVSNGATDAQPSVDPITDAPTTANPVETTVSSGSSQVPAEPTTDAVPVIPVETTVSNGATDAQPSVDPITDAPTTANPVETTVSSGSSQVPAEPTTVAVPVIPGETTVSNGATDAQPSVDPITDATTTVNPVKPTQVPSTLTPTQLPSTANPTQAPSTSKPDQMVCIRAGVFPHINDCSKYYRCLQIFGLGIYKYDFSCPINYFFDATSGKCSKDKTVCQDKKFKCSAAGVFSDPFDSKIFYWCINNLFGGFYQSQHECRKQEVFNSIRKRCESIIEDKPSKELDNEANDSHESNKSTEKPINGNSNEDNTKEEEDNNDSEEHNESQEDSKDKSKENNKDKSKEDSKDKSKEDSKDKSKEDSKDKSKEKEKKKDFKCTEEGTFADPKDDNKYYICTYKNKEKNKFKQNHLKCDKKYVFDEDEGKCVRD